MKIIIVGGSGFIGTRLTRRLIQSGKGHSITIIDKRQSDFFPELTKIADICDRDALFSMLEPCDVLVHLAAEHKDNVIPKSLYHDVNVLGSKNVISGCEKHGINKIIFTSSVAVYGFCAPDTDEQGEINPFNEYGRTKYEAECVFNQWYNAAEGRTLTIVRPTVVFGERNRGNVYNLIRQIGIGLFIMIGNGKNVKSMAYVENVVAFFEYLLDVSPGNRVFNYVDKPDFDMNRLVELVFKLMGKKPYGNIRLPYPLGMCGGFILDMFGKVLHKQFPISAIRIKKFCATTMLAANKYNEFGYKPPVPLAEAIERTVRFDFLNEKTDELTFDTE